MNNKSFTVSIVVALFAVMTVYNYVETTEQEYRAKFGAMVTVVVAKRNIRELEVLDETNLETRAVPKMFIQPGAIHVTDKPNQQVTANRVARALREVKGSLAMAPILKGEQITNSKVTMLGARTGLSRQVSIGKRAFTISVNEVSGVAQLIKPGDRVDVVALIDPAGGNKQVMETRTVLQDVIILSVGKNINNSTPAIYETDPFNSRKKRKVNLNEYTNFNTVTVEVDPYQVQQLVYLTEAMSSKLFLALRNNDDNVRQDLTTSGLEDVLGQNSKAYRRARMKGGSGPASTGGRPNISARPKKF